jgi:hypothetical protein
MICVRGTKVKARIFYLISCGGLIVKLTVGFLISIVLIDAQVFYIFTKNLCRQICLIRCSTDRFSEIVSTEQTKIKFIKYLK